MKLFRYAVLLFTAVPLLGGCAELKELGITCTANPLRITCGVDQPVGQDLSAQGAKDEKPVGPVEEPSSGSEEATP